MDYSIHTSAIYLGQKNYYPQSLKYRFVTTLRHIVDITRVVDYNLRNYYGKRYISL
jgi:hypothetical protein